MSINKKAVAALMALAIPGAGLQGRHTFRSAGADIKRGGQAIEDAADRMEFHETREHPYLASALSQDVTRAHGLMGPVS
ncbi:MAG: hypothetical protein ACLFV4_01630 [Candidatus Hydrogenedentota bacterium]